MSVKRKVFIAKIKRFNEVGPIDMMTQKTKDTIALIVLDAMIWLLVVSLLSPVFAPATYRIEVASAAVVSADADSGTTGGEVIKTTHEEEPRKESTPQPSIIDMIKKEFGENSDKALQIAQCESQLNPNAHGDIHIMYEQNGKQYGDSIGIFQVRTFEGRPTREQLRSAEFNIKYAKQIYDRQGWGAWFNCARMTGVID